MLPKKFPLRNLVHSWTTGKYIDTTMLHQVFWQRFCSQLHSCLATINVIGCSPRFKSGHGWRREDRNFHGVGTMRHQSAGCITLHNSIPANSCLWWSRKLSSLQYTAVLSPLPQPSPQGQYTRQQVTNKISNLTDAAHYCPCSEPPQYTTFPRPPSRPVVAAVPGWWPMCNKKLFPPVTC